MKKDKAFDCVELKNRLQADLAKEYAGLSDEQRRARMARELADADDPVARRWRALSEAKQAHSLAPRENE